MHRLWPRTPALSVSIIAVLALLAACGPLDRDSEAEEVDELALGEELYRENCEVCHGGETGGEIHDVPPPHNAQGHTWHHGDCWLMDMVMDGNSEVRQQLLQDQGVPPEDAVMPAFGDQLSEDEAMAILAFIKTWWTEDQRQHQERVTADVC